MENHENFRVEKDFLGEKLIPSSSYWGIHTLRAQENFPYHQPVPKPLIHAYFAVKWACSKTNWDIGLLDPKKGSPILQACQEGFEGKWDTSIVVSFFQGGAGTSLNMNVNEVIANRALEIAGYEKGNYQIIHPLDDINMSQSTNDTFPTSLRVASLWKLNELEKEIIALQTELQQKEKEFATLLKTGRTEFQDAVPITLGMEFGAWAEAIGRDRWRLWKSKERLKEVNLGGTAVGTGLNAHPRFSPIAISYLNQLTELPLVRSMNMFENTQNTDVFAEVSGLLKALAVNLRKIANDLRLLAMGPRAGIGEIILPPLQEGSSIMPGKINPVMCEYVEGITIDVMGKDQAIGFSCSSGSLELNHLLPFIGSYLLSMLDELIIAIRNFREKYIRPIKASVDRCKDLLEQSFAYATAIVPYLGHDLTSEIVRESLARNLTLREILIEKQLFTSEQLNVILTPIELTRPGIPGYEKLKEKKS